MIMNKQDSFKRDQEEGRVRKWDGCVALMEELKWEEGKKMDGVKGNRTGVDWTMTGRTELHLRGKKRRRCRQPGLGFEFRIHVPEEHGAYLHWISPALDCCLLLTGWHPSMFPPVHSAKRSKPGVTNHQLRSSDLPLVGDLDSASNQQTPIAHSPSKLRGRSGTTPT